MKNVRSSKITNAARGQQCTVGILAVCNRDPSTVVAAHLPDESHGIGIKAHDLFVVFACSACHDVMDGRRRWPAEEEGLRNWYMLRALKRTLLALFAAGVVRLG